MTSDDICAAIRKRFPAPEYATLFEDVLVEFKLPGQAAKQLMGTLRKGTVEKTGGVSK